MKRYDRGEKERDTHIDRRVNLKRFNLRKREKRHIDRETEIVNSKRYD